MAARIGSSEAATWEAVQAERPNRGPRTYKIGRGSKLALAGIAKCDHCGGGISTQNTKTSRGRVTAYACGWHHKRGQSVCPVTVCQPADEVEGALVEYMCATVLTDEIVERIVADVTAEIERAIAAPSESTALEVELAQLRSEQKKYAAAVAAAPDVSELVAELQRRSVRIRQIEADLAGRRPPSPDAPGPPRAGAGWGHSQRYTCLEVRRPATSSRRWTPSPTFAADEEQGLEEALDALDRGEGVDLNPVRAELNELVRRR